MPNRIDKLLGVLSSSTLLEKNILIAAIRKRRPDAPRGREEVLDQLLSYEKGVAFKQAEKNYRLYSRLTLVLAAIVRSPSYDKPVLADMK